MPDWQPIEGFTKVQTQMVQGNALDHPVGWKANTDYPRLRPDTP